MSFYQHVQSLYNRFPLHWRSSIILGGGCLRAYYDLVPIKDIDCFFRCKEDYETIREAMGEDSRYVLRKTAERFCEYTYLPDGTVVNLVGFVFGSPEEQLHRFDFRCCQFVAWIDEQGVLREDYDLEAPDDAQYKLLYIQNNNGTERTLRRIQHYIEDYGYRLHPEQTVEQEDAFEDEFNPETDAHQPFVHPSICKAAPPDYMRHARRRIAALPVQHYPYAGG